MKTSTIRFDPPRRRWPGALLGALAALGGVAAIAWVGWGPVDPGPAPSPAVPVASADRAALASPAVPRPAAPVPIAAAAPGEPAPPANPCTYQSLHLAHADGRRQTACVGPARASQSGDLRRIDLDAHGRERWTLQVDTGGGRVLAARLTGPGGEHACGDLDGDGDPAPLAACRGFAVGAREQGGGRRLLVRGAPLTALSHPGGPTLALTAEIALRGDEQDPDLACLQERLLVVEAQGGSWELCSAGGASRSWHDDGGQTVSVRGPAADELSLQFDAAGRVLRVELDGLSCRDAGCSGAAVVAGAAPAPSGESADVAGSSLPLRLEFAGVSLDDGRPGGRRASLNGVLQVPSW